MAWAGAGIENAGRIRAIADAVSWSAIWARTTHQQGPSPAVLGLLMPVGFKKRADSHVGVTVHAARASVLVANAPVQGAQA